MKKNKLKLDQIKVESYVTSADKVNGGARFTNLTPILTTNNPDRCGIRWTFMDPLTGGCKPSDLQPCPDDPQTLPPIGQ